MVLKSLMSTCSDGPAVSLNGSPSRGEYRYAQDHRPDVLCCCRFEEICATTGAVAHIVADQVGYDRGIARIILGDSCLDLTDEVRASVSSFGAYAPAQLGEKRNEASSKPKTHNTVTIP